MLKLSDKFIKKYSYINDFEKEKGKYIKEIIEKKQSMLDWLDIDTLISKEDLNKIFTLSNKIRNDCDVFIVIGIGGSFLGTKAIYEALNPYFKKGKMEVIFLGYNMDDEYINEVIEHIKDKRVYVNVISKSGNTLETSYAFKKIRQFLKNNDSNYKKRIIITTGSNGHLRDIVNRRDYESFLIPDNIGGRFSCLSVVGLFPLCVMEIDILKLLEGAKSTRNCFDSAYLFALIRYHLENSGKTVEALTIYNEKLLTLASWYQQLFCETQGKNGKGILTFPNLNTTNLHSIGQYLQDGRRQVFETVITFKNNNFNNNILDKVAYAHYLGDCPSFIIELSNLDEFNLGQLIYFLEVSSVCGAFLLNVNPFNQPGVEKYKECLLS